MLKEKREDENMEKSVEIYTTSTCPYCRKVKEFLDENNVSYTNHDVGKDRKELEKMIEKTGQMAVPVILIDGKKIVGLDKKAIKEELGL
jgi:glutaredoxin-like YruB-family protein